SGTIAGSMYIHLNLASTSKVTAEVNIYPREGSLTGTGSASYRVQGGVAVFSGTMSITRGTGKYAKARASGLRFTGTIQRRNDAVAVQLSGRLSY
ncbi:MAG TPA: autotransporter, partial [Solirubrobacteraceae bacterium]